MVFGWLCGGHAGLRQRLEHQEHGFDKSNFCLESLPNMTDFPNHRWRAPACVWGPPNGKLYDLPVMGSFGLFEWGGGFTNEPHLGVMLEDVVPHQAIEIPKDGA